MRAFQFYFVSTPIGNLDDLSIRAAAVLKEVDLVLAEDTRRARVLFGRYGIQTPVRSYHDHNRERVASDVLVELEAGKRVALISEAGTPIISDPGYYLVRKLIERGIDFTAVPGASAVTTSLVLSGLPPDRFSFFGYVPRKPADRERVIREAGAGRGTAIFFETPHRLRRTLEVIDRLLGDREVVVARELTKQHEEVVRGRAKEILTHFDRGALRGEMTLLIRGIGRKRTERTA